MPRAGRAREGEEVAMDDEEIISDETCDVCGEFLDECVCDDSEDDF